MRGAGDGKWRNIRWDALGVDDLLEHVDHVVELSVDVADDNYRLLDSNHIRLVSCKTSTREKN